MLRAMLPFLLLLGATILAARTAHAADAVVVVDRGSAARERAEDIERRAIDLITRLRARELETVLVVYGTRPGGKARVAVGRGDPAEALEKAASLEGFGFEAPTDARRALTAALRGLKADAGTVLLLGPFSGAEEGDPGGRDALDRWDAEAAEGVRVFALDLEADGTALLAGARGVLPRGTIVQGARALAATSLPWSAFPPGDGEPVLEARLRVEFDVLEVGPGAAGDLLRAEGDGGEVRSRDGRGTWHVRRPLGLGRNATVRWHPVEGEDRLWLAAAPEPTPVTWGDPVREARLEAPSAEAPIRFDALDVRVGTPVEHVFSLLVADTGAIETWQWRDAGGKPLPGLEVQVGDVVRREDGRRERLVTVRFAARPAEPWAVQGVTRLHTDFLPDPLEIPYRITVPPGRVALHLDAPLEPKPLPADPAASPWRLSVTATNENASPTVRAGLRTDPPELLAALRLFIGPTRDRAVRCDATSFEVPVDTTTELFLESSDAGIDQDGRVTLTLVETDGVEGEAKGLGRVRPRRPWVRVSDEAWRYHVKGGRLVGAPALRFVLEADGGTGKWLLTRQATAPSVVFPEASPTRWRIEPEGPGRWRLEPDGEWRGTRAAIFEGHVEHLAPEVEWTWGEAPGAVPLEVRVPPRWGMAGWILIGLAAIGVLLAMIGLSHLKAPPVRGTLLYTIGDRPGVVGRLDLEPTGRRTTPIRESRDGKLVLGRGQTGRRDTGRGDTGRGDTGRRDAVIARVRPTRVGGVVEVPAGSAGRRPTRHLLVDGLTIEIGRHRLRYVSGRPSDTAAPEAEGPEEDLLGPEFDLHGGRIASLGPSEPDSPEEEPPTARS